MKVSTRLAMVSIIWMDHFLFAKNLIKPKNNTHISSKVVIRLGFLETRELTNKLFSHTGLKVGLTKEKSGTWDTPPAFTHVNSMDSLDKGF